VLGHSCHFVEIDLYWSAPFSTAADAKETEWSACAAARRATEVIARAHALLLLKNWQNQAGQNNNNSWALLKFAKTGLNGLSLELRGPFQHLEAAWQVDQYKFE
jgi:hypothetical protein